MNSSDMKRLQSGDLVEYQQPTSHRTARGTFQRWQATSGGQVRLLVHTQQLGMDLPIDPQRVIRITHQSLDGPSPAPFDAAERRQQAEVLARWQAAPGDPQDKRLTIPATSRPERRPSEVQGAGSRRLNRQTAWLSLAALLLVGVLSVGVLLLAQGPLPTAQRLGLGSPAGHTPGSQHSPTPSPGSSTPPTGRVPTPPAPGTIASPGTIPTPAPTGLPTAPPGGSPTAAAPAPRLSVNPTRLVFFLQIGTCVLYNPSQALTIQNTGGGSLSWRATIQNPAYVSIDTSSGTLGPSGTSQMRVTASCGVTVSATDTITLTSNGGNVQVTITITLS